MSVKHDDSGWKQLKETLTELANKRVLVGVPEDKAQRKDGKINNAQIGYLNEFGSPSQNIPARDHLRVGVKAAKDEVAKCLEKGAKSVLKSGNIDDAIGYFDAAGEVASGSVKKLIADGLSPELSLSTIKQRERSNASRKRNVKKQKAAGTYSISQWKPLINTGEYRKSITSVVVDKGK